MSRGKPHPQHSRDAAAILLACVGSQDPENKLGHDGPILTVLGERQFSRVFVFATPDFQERARHLEERVQQRFAETAIQTVRLAAEQPHDLRSVLPALGLAVDRIQNTWARGGVSIFVCPQPGTPAMAASWYLLVTERNLPARLLFSTDPSHRRDGQSNTYEADYTEIFARMGWPRAREVLARRLDDVRLDRWPNPVGKSKAIQRALERVRKFARSHEALLIHGPSGSGKELFAYQAHAHSNVSQGPYVPVNASQLDDNLARAELFGYVKGAFTGASRDHEGFVMQADRGTLFLDEFGDLPPSVQPMLLRLIEQGECPVVGGRTLHPSVRLVAATNRPLDSLRKDLVQRFPLQVELPSLEEHKEDIPLLVDDFLNRRDIVEDAGSRSFAPDLMRWCCRQRWADGNARELKAFVHRVVMLCPQTVITLDQVRQEAPDLLAKGGGGTPHSEDLRGNELKKAYASGGVRSIHEALVRALNEESTLTGAAKRLDINRKTLDRYREECRREELVLPPTGRKH